MPKHFPHLSKPLQNGAKTLQIPPKPIKIHSKFSTEGSTRPLEEHFKHEHEKTSPSQETPRASKPLPKPLQQQSQNPFKNSCEKISCLEALFCKPHFAPHSGKVFGNKIASKLQNANDQNSQKTIESNIFGGHNPIGGWRFKSFGVKEKSSTKIIEIQANLPHKQSFIIKNKIY